MRRLWIVFLSLACVSAAFGQSINARFSTSFYSWERSVTDSTSQNHVRIYETGRITLGQLGTQKLSFHAYGQVANDFSQQADNDPIPRLYNAYLQWVDSKGVLSRARLGRQRVYSGVAYGTIDGIDVSLKLGRRVKLGAFAGTLVPLSTSIEVANWDESHAFGFRAGTSNLLGAKVLLSYMQRNRRPVAYAAPGRYTGKLISFESLEQRLAGLDVSHRIDSHLNVYGRLDYDLVQERVRRAQLEMQLAASKKLNLTGEFVHRAPLIEANSIFSVFEQNASQYLGLRANYRVAAGWSANGNFGFQKLDGDEAIRFGVGLRCKYGYLGYNFRTGYGGQNNGLNAAINYPLTESLALTASTGVARYSLFDENAEDNTSLTGSLGVNYRPSKHFSLDVVGHGVRNRFVSSDFRFFAKANYWFFKSGR